MNKYIAVLVAAGLFLLAEAVLAQTSLGKCSVTTVSPKLPGPKIIHSPNAEYIARIQWDSAVNVSPIVEIFHAPGPSKYALLRKVSLEAGAYPEFVMISDNGRLVVLGNRFARVQTDQLRIYTVDGKVAYVVDGSEVFSATNLEESRRRYSQVVQCTPPQPWICWQSDLQPHIEQTGRERVVLTSTLGGIVEVDLESGKVVRNTGTGGYCRMFDRE